MAAVITKNQVTASLRQVNLFPVFQDGGLVLAPRGTDFIALGNVYVPDAANVPHGKLATGTMVNVRKPIAFTSFTFTADSTTDLLTKTTHGLETGDGPVRVSNSGGALPGGLAAATDYWVYNPNTGGTGGNTLKLCTSLANAYAGTGIDITSNGTGTQTLASSSTYRGIDGNFEYTFPQPETNADLTELWVLIEGNGYSRSNMGGIYATVNMPKDVKGFESTAEGSYTYGDLARLTARTLVARFTKTLFDYVFRDLANSKDSHSMTVVAGGRTASTIIDPT